MTEPGDTVADVDWQAYEAEAIAAYESASTLDELNDVNVRFLGRRAELPQALRQVRDRETGKTLNELRTKLEEAQYEAGARIGLGYEVVDGNEVETVEYIFDKLNMPEGHVTRSPLHTYYLSDDVVLRTETSASQVRTMESKPPPVYMVSLGRVYRRDTPDPKRYPIFHQVEGLAVDKGITLADLKGTLQLLLRRLFGDERDVRIRTSFFPFTEPSVEADVSCFLCNQKGCRVCEYEGWIEVGGAGMVDPNVFEAVGYDPEEVSGFAFGWGLERIFMLRHGLTDIRMLWQNDLRLLEQF